MTEFLDIVKGSLRVHEFLQNEKISVLYNEAAMTIRIKTILMETREKTCKDMFYLVIVCINLTYIFIQNRSGRKTGRENGYRKGKLKSFY